MGAIEKRAVVVRTRGHPLEANTGDYLAFLPMATLGFSPYDHRVLDGATANVLPGGEGPRWRTGSKALRLSGDLAFTNKTGEDRTVLPRSIGVISAGGLHPLHPAPPVHTPSIRP